MEFDRGYLRWGEIDDVTNRVIALRTGNWARRGFGDNELLKKEAGGYFNGVSMTTPSSQVVVFE